MYNQTNSASLTCSIQTTASLPSSLFTSLIREDGAKIGKIKSLQLEGESIPEAIKNKEVAISIPGATVGRQIDEDMILYSDLNEEDFIKLKKLKSFLNRGEIEVLKEIAEIKRKNKPLWGI